MSTSNTPPTPPSPPGKEGQPAAPLWHGRFGQGPADELWAFTVSLPYDRRLAFDDIRGSRAHVKGLGLDVPVIELSFHVSRQSITRVMDALI